MSHTPLLRTAALLAFACLALACRREDPAPADVPEAPASAATAQPATVPGTDALSVSDNTTAEAGVQPVSDAAQGGLDAKDFAGTFVADGARVEFLPDGTYRMGVHAPSAQATVESDGTWSFGEDGATLLLDPNAKDEADRRYTLVSPDELKASDGDQVLRRQAR